VNKKIDGAFGLGMREIQVAHTMGFYTQAPSHIPQ